MSPRKIGVTELVLRDAHQSLMATRMAMEDMVDACADIDAAGYWSVECWGGATFDSCIRFLNEDPWVRLRTFRELMPNSRLQMLLRGQNLLGYRHYEDTVVEEFVEKSAENGMDVFRVFDALNDPRNMAKAMQAVKKVGKHAQGTICYTISPVHTVEGYVKLAGQLIDMGAESIALKDMAALLQPQPAYDIIRGIKETYGDIQINVHCHSTTGVTLVSLMKAYRELMEIYEVSAFRACATSAMRDAENGAELVEKIYEKTDIRIEIIDGREEARLISADLIRSLATQTEDTFLYVDVGGGSTELNLVRGAELIESRSFDIGTIRQLSGKVRDEERNSFGDYVRTLRSAYGTLRLVGTGGNINKLLRLGAPSERANVNSLPVESLQRVADELRQYTPEQRMQLFRLKPDRAEVIVPAADIFLLVASITEATEIIVPTKGLADGIVDSVCPILP